ncbi:MAG: hypothetical protein JSW34_01985 [Candidatus Zixiibacteriota bacterium]|nr:MAG: hypothetical protein JSW34_01985 [candidate division Zixibacteria bacterium]
MLNTLLDPIRSLRSYIELPRAARAEHRLDRRGLPGTDPGIDAAISESLAWLGRAQDSSTSCDGGVARHYSLLTGWSASYPETTGYIIPTLLRGSDVTGDTFLRERARRMLDWLVSIQLPGGGFQGGLIDSEPVVPVTFNTGQILLGLAAGVKAFGDKYRDPLRRAADWLVQTQDKDGCWRSQPTPFAAPGEKAYETHVAWGLLEAERVEPGRGYGEAAMANVRWSLTKQAENGWFDCCCLRYPSAPLTHTLGYVLRGLTEAYHFSDDENLLKACRKTADGLLSAIRPQDGFLPGRLDANWRGAVSWVCLTGSVQIAYCWLDLYRITKDKRYRDAGFAANSYVRRTVKVAGPLETRGAIKGSFPISSGYTGREYGGYGPYEYLNWVSKFFIDSNILERTIREAEEKE